MLFATREGNWSSGGLQGRRHPPVELLRPIGRICARLVAPASGPPPRRAADAQPSLNSSSASSLHSMLGGFSPGKARKPRASVGLYGTSSPSRTSRSSHEPGGPALGGAWRSSPPATAEPAKASTGARTRRSAPRKVGEELGTVEMRSILRAGTASASARAYRMSGREDDTTPEPSLMTGAPRRLPAGLPEPIDARSRASTRRRCRSSGPRRRSLLANRPRGRCPMHRRAPSSSSRGAAS
jgi:hypothetical protein